MTLARFNWLQYLSLASQMVAQPGEEYARSATSRAYYGVFCTAREALQARRGQRFQSQGSVHLQVINALKGDPNPSIATLGRDMDRLRRERNRADYEGAQPFSEWRAQKSLVLARSIATDLNLI